MSQPAGRPEDLEGGIRADDRLDRRPLATPNQPSQGESNFGDSSGPFFSMYSKVADDEDNKMVERWQKDADGILFFTGLFSAAVAALLAVTVQDLRPNSQDTSAFYLGNIYQVLADPDAPRTSIPSPVPKPPPFSPSRYAIWVNSLWFLSLVIGLTCALMATSLHQWSRRYIRVTQLPRCSPEKRARMRAFFADGVDKMHVPWAVEGLPALLHLSVFLFFGGLAIFLFNIDHAVFRSVILWIGLFSIVYGLITVMPIFWHESPYYSPLSRTAWFLYASMKYVICSITYRYASLETWRPFYHPTIRYRGWMLGGVEKAAEETVRERSSEIDMRIFDWTMGVLGEDESLEKFFEAIPGLFTSKLVKHLERDIPRRLFNTFWFAFTGFMNRTSSSNSVTESVKSRRLKICKDITSVMPCPFYGELRSHFDQTSVSIEELEAMERWLTCKDSLVADRARVGVARNLARMQKRDDNWIAHACHAYGLSESDIRDNVTLGGDNTVLATLIDLSRRAIHSHDWDLVWTLTQFDIHHTLPRLQHDFCTLWNELVQEARSQGYDGISVRILREIRHHYIALHQGTDAAPTAFSASTDSVDFAWYDPSLYPLCHIASHRPDSTTVSNSLAVPLLTQPAGSSDPSPDPPSRGSSAILQQAELANTIAGPPSPSGPTTHSEIGDSSRAPAATSPTPPVHTNPRPTDTATIAPAPAATPPALKSLASYDAGASLSDPLHPASSVSIPASPTPSHAPSLPNLDLLASARSAAETAASFVRSDDPTSQTHTSETAETSQAPVAPFIVQNPDPIPAAMPSAGPDLGGDPGALQTTTSSAYVSHPLEGTQQQDAVVPCAAPGISEISRLTRTDSPTIISGSPSSPVLLPALSDDMTTADLPPSVGAASPQPDHIPHAPRFPSSSLITASPYISSQVSSASDAQVNLSVGTPGFHDDAQDMSPRVPMTVHSDQIARPDRDSVAATLQPEDQEQHDLDTP